MQQHTIEHQVDTMSVQATASTHSTIDTVSVTTGGKDVVIDITETVEHFDTLGRVTSKQTKQTSIHHKDSVTTRTDSHKIFADTSAVVHIQSTHRDTDTTVKEKRKSSFGSITFEVMLGIALVMVIVIVVFIAKKYLSCRL